MLNAAIWGSGFIAGTHVEALRSSNVNIAAVVSRTLEGSCAFAEKWGIPRWSDDPSILFDENIHCVHVCTPPNLHYEMVKTLLEHGKHVICEKPLCFENEQAIELAALAKEKGLVCAVNFNVRYHDACLKAKELVEKAGFGRVLLVHGSYLQEFGALPAWADWRYNEKLAGKMHAVTEIGSHWLDIAQHISGKKLSAVSASFGCFYPERWLEDGMMYAEKADGRSAMQVRSEDAAVISLRFSDGAIGAVTLSEISQGRYNYLSLEVTGENSTLWWNSESNNLLFSARKGGELNSHVFAFGNGFNDTFRRLAADVYTDIAVGCPRENPSYPDFACGRDSVILLNAIYDSAMNNAAWVSVESEEE